MLKTDLVRREIKKLGNNEFCSTDIFLTTNIQTSTILCRLEKMGELELVRREISDNGRSIVNIYRTIKLRPIRHEAKIIRLNKKKQSVKESDNAWEKVWPEFFVDPNFKGTSRIHFHAME